jgi:hypothetical protein
MLMLVQPNVDQIVGEMMEGASSINRHSAGLHNSNMFLTQMYSILLQIQAFAESGSGYWYRLG